jgi:hypothetical protein
MMVFTRANVLVRGTSNVNWKVFNACVDRGIRYFGSQRRTPPSESLSSSGKWGLDIARQAMLG